MQQKTYNNWTNYSEYTCDKEFMNGIQKFLNRSYSFKDFE